MSMFSVPQPRIGLVSLGRRAASVALASLLFAAGPAVAHPGGLDSAGCHAGSEPYHCHGAPSPAPAPAPAPAPTPEPEPVPKPVDPGPSAAELREQAQQQEAQEELPVAEAEAAARRKELEARIRAHRQALVRANAAQRKVDRREATIDGLEERAEERRAEVLREREGTLAAVSAGRDAYENERAAYERNQVVLGAVAGVSLGLLAAAALITMSALIVSLRVLSVGMRILLFGVPVIGSILFFALAFTSPFGFLRLLFGGLGGFGLVTFALAWVALILPLKVLRLAGGFVTGGAALAVAASVALVALAQPQPPAPTPQQQQAAAEQKSDPQAEEDPVAARFERRAERLGRAGEDEEARARELRAQEESAEDEMEAARSDANVAEARVEELQQKAG